MIKTGLISFLLFSVCLAFGQSGEKFVRMSKEGLYDKTTDSASLHISGASPLIIFSDEMGSEVWVSPEKKCVTMERVHAPVAEGNTAIHLRWDKVGGGCDWIGIGFGWEDWQPKDISGNWSKLALSLKVRAVKGSFTNLPVAFAFEDYSGVQTYCGFKLKQASGRFNDSEWTTINVPLVDFPFVRNDANLSKVKQFMVQIEERRVGKECRSRWSPYH